MAECALGVEIAEDRSRCAVAKAWRENPGRVAVLVVWHGPLACALDVVDALYVALDPVDVALDPKSQSSTLCAPLAERGVVVKRLGAEDVAVAHGEFLDAVGGGGLRHFDQPALTQAVRGAQARRLAGASALERRVPVAQEPLTASEFAVFAFRRWEEVASPNVFVI